MSHQNCPITPPQSLLAIAIATLCSCSSNQLEPRMYTVNLTEATIPVMLSDTRYRNVGNFVQANGLKSIEYLNAIDYERTTDKESVYSPSEQMAILTADRNRFVQIQSIAYEAEEYHRIPIARTTRVLRIEAEAVR